jgi:hypothetical protein
MKKKGTVADVAIAILAKQRWERGDGTNDMKNPVMIHSKTS